MKRLYLTLRSEEFVSQFESSTNSKIFDAVLAILTQVFGEGNVALVENDYSHGTFDFNPGDKEVDKNALVGLFAKAFGLSENNIGVLQVSLINMEKTLVGEDIAPAYRRLQEKLGTIDQLRDKLNEVVLGQEHAIDVVCNGLINAYAFEDEDREGPLASFLLAGPAHCGKTLIANIVASVFELPTLEMSKNEYHNGDDDKEEVIRLIHFVKTHPSSIVILNDIEYSRIAQKFLCDILRSGYIQEPDYVDFRNVIFFLTTRAGDSIYEKAVFDRFGAISGEDVIKSCSDYILEEQQSLAFMPEFIPLLPSSNAVILNHLGEVNTLRLMMIHMDEVFGTYKKNTGIEVEGDLYDLCMVIRYANPYEKDLDVLCRKIEEFVKKEISEVYGRFTKQGNIFSAIRKIVIGKGEDGTPEAQALFTDAKEKGLILCLFEEAELFKSIQTDDFELTVISDPVLARAALKQNYDFIWLNPLKGLEEGQDLPIDLADADLEGVELFKYILQRNRRTPLYIALPAGLSSIAGRLRGLMEHSEAQLIFYNENEKDDLMKALGLCALEVEFKTRLTKLRRSKMAISYDSKQDLGETEGKTSAILTLEKLALSPVKFAKLGDIPFDASLRFADIVGRNDAKNSLKKYGEYLIDPKVYLRRGLRDPKALVIHGSDGEGKSMMIKALANETNASYISVDLFKGHDEPTFLDAIRHAFAKARFNAPSVLHFENFAPVFYHERESLSSDIVNLFAKEIEYTASTNKAVLIVFEIGVHYRDDVQTIMGDLFKEVTQTIQVPGTDIKETEEYIVRYLKNNGIASVGKAAVHNMALRLAHQATCADFDLILDHAVEASRGKKTVTEKSFISSLDEFLFGELTADKQSKDDVRATSYHEIGHYMISRLLCKNNAPYVTISPRGDFLGATFYASQEGKYSTTKQDYLNKICSTMAGRAAEIVTFGEERGTNTGIGGDIRQATAIATYMVRAFAMGENMACTIQDGTPLSACPELMKEVGAILKEQFDRAVRLLEKNKEALIKMGDALYEKLSITHEELAELVPDDQLIGD